MESFALAHPSLALTKYWGKAEGGINLPATPSLAVTLRELYSISRCRLLPAGARDSVRLNGEPQGPDRFEPVFEELRRRSGYEGAFDLASGNNFPTAAGLASSASGLAALVTACAGALKAHLSQEELSSLARIGSGSAARSIYGGFTLLPAGAASARPVLSETGWREFRIIAVALHTGAKAISSREAMRRSVDSSPYFSAWVADSQELTKAALEAVEARDIRRLGEIARQSYTRMFATMFSADPPIIYWRPESVAMIHTLEELRSRGVPVWETMDAGPQVKVILLEEQVEEVLRELKAAFPEAGMTVCSPGPGAQLLRPQDLSDEERGLLGEGG
ncbi:MAG: diphosphomevalonate decarboxylase [Alkalispirochaetaceae bacterium]